MELTKREADRIRRRRQAQTQARERFVEEVEDLQGRGYPLAAIARALGVTRQTLWKMLRK